MPSVDEQIENENEKVGAAAMPSADKKIVSAHEERDREDQSGVNEKSSAVSSDETGR